MLRTLDMSAGRIRFPIGDLSVEQEQMMCCAILDVFGGTPKATVASLSPKERTQQAQAVLAKVNAKLTVKMCAFFTPFGFP